ncbi:NYN domain-containing protein [Shewanella corallii]|uniref:NYN domain-containing protein n=1 Tax=Shewanella corallii TaxID=560080 RepID=A0ABT0N9M0_9GAMM|nr:NYN domain-containing protein [Shewanella corallii]MCL2914527.1 NYN domain-containing protein [Shewanella corallii]
MKTKIYIDGYNLYYGCLKGTCYKWLDLKRLFSDYILPSSVPFSYTLAPDCINFYTAKIIEKAGRSPDSVKDQDSYHRAIKFAYPDGSVNVKEGYYSVIKTSAYKVDREQPDKWPRDCERVDIWKLEEKQSDVNLALDAVVDVLTDQELKHVVFVTNDTDLAPALKKIRELSQVKIGLVIPTRDERRANKELESLAHWTRTHITDEELSLSGFPRSILGGKKPASRPESWFGQPDILQEILNTLEEAIPSPSKRWKWLDEKKPAPDGLPKLSDIPANLLDNEESALAVLEHAKAYVKYIKSNK